MRRVALDERLGIGGECGGIPPTVGVLSMGGAGVLDLLKPATQGDQVGDVASGGESGHSRRGSVEVLC